MPTCQLLSLPDEDVAMSKKELYFSTDIESDGPIPGPNSMLSLGCAAFDRDTGLVSTYSRNLETLDGASGDPDTMKWWSTQPDAWAACRKNIVEPSYAMREFCKWIESVCTKHDRSPVFVGYPAGFDFLFVYWYLMKFVKRSPFSFSALDIKSYAMAMLDTEYRQAVKKNFPKRWFGKTKHNHVALDDAIGQGEMFVNMMRECHDVRENAIGGVK